MTPLPHTAPSQLTLRVVMYSGGAELEMRGRCSAGQKVSTVVALMMVETTPMLVAATARR